MWGMCVRLMFTYHTTWLVNSASHAFGYRNFPVNDLSTNCWWVALLTGGEGWHNNHPRFSHFSSPWAEVWEVDLAYAFIRSLQVFGLAWDLQTPAAKKLQFSPR